MSLRWIARPSAVKSLKNRRRFSTVFVAVHDGGRSRTSCFAYTCAASYCSWCSYDVTRIANAWKSLGSLYITRDASSIAAIHSFRRQWRSADSLSVEVAGAVALAWSRVANTASDARTRPRLASRLTDAV